MHFLKLTTSIILLAIALNSCDFHYNNTNASSDTLVVKSDAAIFYYPDSASLDSLKGELDEQAYQDAISDYIHFMDNASRYLDLVKLEKLTTVRGEVLKFIAEDKSEYIIDTNTLTYFWGIIFFSKRKRPKLIDMTIIDIEYKSYY